MAFPSSSSFQPEGTEAPKSPDYGPIEPEPDTTFYFESDHLALKANVDYLKLLKHVALLEVQRKLIVQDLEFYYDLENQITHSSKPSELAKKIANKEMKIPPKRRIAKKPTIDWTKYNIQPSSQNVKPEPTSSSSAEGPHSTSKAQTSVPCQTKNVTKPETFNKPWSAEEQIRLEELLLKYPPEKSDSARFRKIAQELGNRTLTQVCSRVQKYHKKMRRLGRVTANFTSHQKSRKAAKIIHKKNKMLVRESTFLPALSVQSENKIFMDRSSSEENGSEEDTGREEEEGEKMEMSTTEQWLRILERIKRDKGNEIEMRSVVHHDLQCFVCKEQPIQGTRWHCLSCSCNDTSLNLCNDCTVLQLHSPAPERVHPLNHLMHPYPLLGFHTVTSDGQPLDLNYLPSSAFASSSYLDPNIRTEY